MPWTGSAADKKNPLGHRHPAAAERRLSAASRRAGSNVSSLWDSRRTLTTLLMRNVRQTRKFGRRRKFVIELPQRWSQASGIQVARRGRPVVRQMTKLVVIGDLLVDIPQGIDRLCKGPLPRPA
jgi:hypothetical protein